MDDVTQWVVEQSPLVVILIALVAGFMREWIVPGGTHRRQQEVINSQRDTIAIQAEALHKATEGLELANGLIKSIDDAVNGKGRD